MPGNGARLQLAGVLAGTLRWRGRQRLQQGLLRGSHLGRSPRDSPGFWTVPRPRQRPLLRASPAPLASTAIKVEKAPCTGCGCGLIPVCRSLHTPEGLRASRAQPSRLRGEEAFHTGRMLDLERRTAQCSGMRQAEVGGHACWRKWPGQGPKGWSGVAPHVSWGPRACRGGVWQTGPECWVAHPLCWG